MPHLIAGLLLLVAGAVPGSGARAEPAVAWQLLLRLLLRLVVLCVGVLLWRRRIAVPLRLMLSRGRLGGRLWDQRWICRILYRGIAGMLVARGWLGIGLMISTGGGT